MSCMLHVLFLFETGFCPRKLGITRIQGRVVAKNAQTMATPFSDQQCVMYSASASQKRQEQFDFVEKIWNI